MEEKNTIKKLNIAIVALVLLIVTIVQISLINNINVWQDELFTMLLMKYDSETFWDWIIQDVHPPLYYLILRPVAKITNCNISILKLVSIFPTILLSIIISIMTLKDKEKAKSKLTTVLLPLFIIATTLTHNFLTYSVELRMYSWAMFFVTMSGIYAYKTYKNPSKKNIAIFILLSLGSAYTHYYALIMEVVIYFYLFLTLFIQNKANIKKIVVISLITIIGYLPWLGFAIKQFSSVVEDYWITFEAKSILEYINTILTTKADIYYGLQPAIIILFIALFASYLYKVIKSKQQTKEEKAEKIFAMYAFSMPFIIIIIGIILNILIRPIYVGRYVFPAVGLFWLGIIIMLKSVKPKKLLIICTYILVIAMAEKSYISVYEREYDKSTEKFINYMDGLVKKGDIMIGSYRVYYSAFLMYFFMNNTSVEVSKFTEVIENGELDVDLDKVNLWYFEKYNTEETDEIKILKEAGYNLERIYVDLIDGWIQIAVYKVSAK